MTPHTIRVLLADDHQVLLAGLRLILEAHPAIEVVGAATDGGALLELVGQVAWDVLVLDLFLSDRDGFDLISRICRRFDDSRILVLSTGEERTYGLRALRAGASGFIHKSAAPEQVVDAVLELARGGTAVVSPQLAHQLAVLLDPRRSAADAPHTRLSEREFQVLLLLGSGLTPTQAAGKLCLSAKTIATYRRRVLDKLGLEDTPDLVAYVQHEGLLEHPR